MEKTLDALLADIECEVSENDVLEAQNNISEAKKEENIKMHWRMYAADPFDDDDTIK